MLLGAVLEDGNTTTHPQEYAELTGWAGEVVREHRFFNVEEIATLCTNPELGGDREGFVVLFPHDGYRIKVKFAKYLTLHKTMTNLTHRRVHEMFLARLTDVDGPDLWEAFLEGLPDEMDTAVQAIVDDIVAQAELTYEQAIAEADHLRSTCDIRREVAARVVKSFAKYTWLAYDGKWETLAIQCVRAIEMPVTPVLAIEDDA